MSDFAIKTMKKALEVARRSKSKAARDAVRSLEIAIDAAERERRGDAVTWGECEFSERLLKITRGCRPDMHEPDQSEVYAEVPATSSPSWAQGRRVKNKLDNAMGDNPGEGELVVVLTKKHWDDDSEREDEARKEVEHFNLATLIAFARFGARMILAANGRTIVPREYANFVRRVDNTDLGDEHEQDLLARSVGHMATRMKRWHVED